MKKCNTVEREIRGRGREKGVWQDPENMQIGQWVLREEKF